MHNLVGWLLQTDPNRRPSIQQVLTHVAIADKVRELQMLYPSCVNPQIKRKDLAKPNKPVLPLQSKRGVVQKDLRSMQNLKKKPQQNMKSSKNSDHERASMLPRKVSALNQIETSQTNFLVSVGEIEKLKQLTKANRVEITPRPNMLPVENLKKYSKLPQSPSIHIKATSFLKGKKGQDNAVTRIEGKPTQATNNVIDQKSLHASPKVNINESINSRKERINQLLSYYGKSKENSPNKVGNSSGLSTENDFKSKEGSKNTAVSPNHNSPIRTTPDKLKNSPKVHWSNGKNSNPNEVSQGKGSKIQTIVGPESKEDSFYKQEATKFSQKKSINQSINDRLESSLKRLEMSTKNLLEGSVQEDVPRSQANFRFKRTNQGESYSQSNKSINPA